MKDKTTTPMPPCGCGCGSPLKSAQRRFLQGHDAKLKGRVVAVRKLEAAKEAGKLNGGQQKSLAKQQRELAPLIGSGSTCVCCGQYISDPETTPDGPMGSVCAKGLCGCSDTE